MLRRERERELLDSLKQAEIANVVTKGLNPNAPMKDSGIPWIGMIPEHWEVRRLKTVATCNDEALSENTQPDKIINYVEIADVDCINGINKITKYRFCDAPSRARRITRKNDIIVSTVRTYLQAIAPIKQDDLIVSTGFAVIRPTDNVNSIYFSYIMRSIPVVSWIVSHSKGVNYPAINTSELCCTPIPIPPLSEQRAIVSYIESRMQKIDAYITGLQAEIDYLKEFKQRLISDVVTGKIDVINK